MASAFVPFVSVKVNFLYCQSLNLLQHALSWTAPTSLRITKWIQLLLKQTQAASTIQALKKLYLKII
jgi:hypothetical protein